MNPAHLFRLLTPITCALAFLLSFFMLWNASGQLMSSAFAALLISLLVLMVLTVIHWIWRVFM